LGRADLEGHRCLVSRGCFGFGSYPNPRTRVESDGEYAADRRRRVRCRPPELHVSLAETRYQAEEQAVKERPNCWMPFPRAHIREPEDVEVTSADLDEVYPLDGGRMQAEFIRVYRERVMPIIDWPEKD
jgi:hypothetical protein